MEGWVEEEGNAVALSVARCADAVQRRAKAPIGPPAHMFHSFTLVQDWRSLPQHEAFLAWRSVKDVYKHSPACLVQKYLHLLSMSSRSMTIGSWPYPNPCSYVQDALDISQASSACLPLQHFARIDEELLALKYPNTDLT